MILEDWIPVEVKPPEGECLVTLEEPMLNQLVFSADFNGKVNSIGCYFDFDCPKVIAWTPKPKPYVKQD